MNDESPTPEISPTPSPETLELPHQNPDNPGEVADNLTAILKSMQRSQTTPDSPSSTRESPSSRQDSPSSRQDSPGSTQEYQGFVVVPDSVQVQVEVQLARTIETLRRLESEKPKKSLLSTLSFGIFNGGKKTRKNRGKNKTRRNKNKTRRNKSVNKQKKHRK